MSGRGEQDARDVLTVAEALEVQALSEAVRVLAQRWRDGAEADPYPLATAVLACAEAINRIVDVPLIERLSERGPR